MKFIAFCLAVVLMIPYTVLALICDLLDTALDLLLTYADGE